MIVGIVVALLAVGLLSGWLIGGAVSGVPIFFHRPPKR